MQHQFEELLSRLDQLSAQFYELREGIRQAITIAELDPEMSLTRARKVLELVVRRVYERRIGEPAGTRPLENLLQTLVKDGHLPRLEAAYADTVRQLGNVGTHVFGEQITSADVLQALSNLMPVVEWYFEQESVPSDTVLPPSQLPKTWILVAGSAERTLPSPLISVCNIVGKLLAEEGYGLVTGGGRPGSIMLSQVPMRRS
jgi:hypothetical protein